MAKYPPPRAFLLTSVLLFTFLQGGYFMRQQCNPAPYEVTISNHSAIITPETLPPTTAPTQKINLSTASIEALQTLPHIGFTRATAIIAWREANGPFSTADHVLSVPGMGIQLFDSIKDYIIFQ